jgi:hypothetical protein
VKFSLNLLLSLLNPLKGSKDLGRPGSIGNASGYHGSTRNSYSMTLGGGSTTSWTAAAAATRSNVQYNPAGDTRQRIRTSSLEIGFLGLKILIVCFESHLNTEW